MLETKQIFSLLLLCSSIWYRANAQGNLIAKYNNEIGRGQITVELEGGKAPYRYLISKIAIPSKEEIFNTFDKAMQLSAKKVTPSSFLPADVNSPSYVFSDLDAGNYYVKVWDNKNEIIVNNQEVQVSPSVKLINASRLSVKKNVISSQEANGWGSSTALIEGGLQIADYTTNVFDVQIPDPSLSCFFTIQPSDKERLLKEPSSIEAGIVIKERKADLIVSGKSLFSISVRENDYLTWGFDKGKLILSKNGSSLFAKEIKTLLPDLKATSTYNIAVSFASKGSLQFNPLTPLNPEPISFKAIHGSCGIGLGTIDIIENTIAQANDVTYTLYNSAGGIVGTQTGAPLSQTYTNLTPGDYQLNYSYQLSWYWGNQQITRVKKITVGVNTQWGAATSSINLSGNSAYSTINSTSGQLQARADANNILRSSQEGWIDFQTLYAAQSAVSVWGIGGNKGLSNALNQINYPAQFFKNSLFTFIEDYDGNPATYFQTINNRFRLQRKSSGNIELYNGTNATPIFSIPGYNNDFYIGLALNSKDDAFLNVITSYACAKPKTFVRAQKELDGSFYRTSSGKLYVQYKEEYNASTFQFKVYNEMNREEVINVAPTQFRGYGENGIEFDFSSLPIKKYYVLEITNPKDEKWYLRFLN